MDINKIREFIEVFHPFLRGAILFIYLSLFLFVNRMFVKDKELRASLMGSFMENGVASGKSITAFMLSSIIGFATVVAIVYADSHILPEYFLISILTFIASLYGIRMASKYLNNSDTQSTTSKSSTTLTTEITEKIETPNKQNEVNEENPETKT